MSLFGIESEDDCRREIDTLLVLHARAKEEMSKQAVAALKSALAEYYRKGDSLRGTRQMSQVEEQYFWPAIQEAYSRAPNLNNRRKWNEDLWEVKDSLRSHRPGQS